MNEIAAQYEAAVKYGRDHEQIAALLAYADETGFHDALHDYLIDSGHPLAAVAQAVINNGRVTDTYSGMDPESRLFRQMLSPHGSAITITGKWRSEPFAGDEPTPEGLSSGRSLWALRYRKGKHPKLGNGYFVEASFPKYHKWEEVATGSGLIHSRRTYPHREAAFLQPEEMAGMLRVIANDPETSSITKQVVKRHLSRHFPNPKKQDVDSERT